MFWDRHINHAIKKFSKSVGVMAKLHSFLPRNIIMNIYNTLFNVQFKLLFLSLALNHINLSESTAPDSKKKGKRNKAIRHIAGVFNNAHPKEFFIPGSILISIPNLYSYILSIMYKQSLRNNEQKLLSLWQN